MNAENYLKVHLGKLFRYDKQPKYFTKEMVIQLMEGFAKHKKKEFPYSYVDFIHLLTKLNKYKEAISELENDLQKSQSKIDMLTDGMDTIYHLFREVYNEAVIELRKEIKRLQSELKEAKEYYQRAVKLCDNIQSERTEAMIKLDKANKTIDELRGQLNYEQNKTL